MWLIIALVVVVVLLFLFRHHKKLKLGDVCCFTGGVKTGKSTLALWYARKIYKKNLFCWRIKNFFSKLFRRKEIEKPLFYSNIKLACDYVPMTREIFLREVRIAYKSVCFVDESSLIADSQDWRDKNINEKLKMFNKLYGHESRGGTLVYDTQTMRDNHYAIKRCMNTYIWIHHAVKWIPFVYVCRVREMFYSEDGEAVNVSDSDVENQLMWLVISKKIWKTFDCYTYSCFTDDLPVADSVVHGSKSDLKTPYLVDLRERDKGEVIKIENKKKT